jgi:Mu-like prophage I protein
MRFFKKITASTPEIGTPYQRDGIWRIDNVPICSTGIEYNLGTGPHTFTESELADAVKAASGSDIAVNPPRIKLGHASKANELFLTGDEPAFGRVEGMRLSPNKQTIIGDFVGTPEWLSKVLPVAFPSRSVDASLDAETATGKKYEMIITDVSLLGIRWPGCSVLEDLPLWYGPQAPQDVEIDRVAASVGVPTIRRKFYNDGPGKLNERWWIRGERFDNDDGYNLIVDEGDGEICRIPVAVDGEEVMFGDAIPVVEQYPDKAVAAQAVLAGMKMADPAMVIHASRAETDRPDQNQKGEEMDEELRKSLASRLGLSPDATEDQIRTELAKPVEAQTPPPPPPDTGDDDDGDDNPDPNQPPGPAGETVTLDKATYDALKKGAELAMAHEGERKTARINDTIAAAVAEGRIPPARREHWKKALTADFDGSKAVLDSMEPGLIPLAPSGSAGNGDPESGEHNQGEGLPESWFPEIATIRANAAKGRVVVNAKEG